VTPVPRTLTAAQTPAFWATAAFVQPVRLDLYARALRALLTQIASLGRVLTISASLARCLKALNVMELCALLILTVCPTTAIVSSALHAHMIMDSIVMSMNVKSQSSVSRVIALMDIAPMLIRMPTHMYGYMP